MTFEFKNLINATYSLNTLGEKTIWATVVALEGSSYRRPGVRMLISETGRMIGAVSGGCVEKEIVRQAQAVFQSNESKMMMYDGRFRLGCEGILYILLEPVIIGDELYKTLQLFFNQRKSFTCHCFFSKEWETGNKMGSVLHLEGKIYALNPNSQNTITQELQTFSETFSPIFQLCIIGAEHDAVQLCKMANQVGWEVHIIAPPDDQKTIDSFEGATHFSSPTFEALDFSDIDEHTAVVLMTHSFNKDLQYLLALKTAVPRYLGLLGPKQRRERLFSKLLEFEPNMDSSFFEHIYGPTGINIGAESPAEIAVSIIAEILSVTRNQDPILLKDKKGTIHE
ncbi:MAG: XdhC family protein [Flavobacteriaceae bacterium]